jgi:hypothetical protein
LEIWDANNKPVFKQRKVDEDFRAGESRQLEFSWVLKLHDQRWRLWP